MARDRAAAGRDRGGRARARSAPARLPGVPERPLAGSARADAGAALLGRRPPRARGRLVRRRPDAGAVRPARRAAARHRRRARRGRDRRVSSPSRGEELHRVLAAADRSAPRGERRRGQLRRHAERQLHERLLLPLRLLRVLEGEAGREPARARVRRADGGDRAPRRRGLGAGRGRDLPPGRDPPGLRRRLLRRGLRGDQARQLPGSARARVLGARGLAGRSHARRAARLLPRPPARRRPGLASGHSGRDPRRRGSCGALPGQGEHGAVAGGARDRTPGGSALHGDDHVRARRHAEELGAASAARPRAPAAHRRVHRAGAAAVRAHGGADLPEGPGTRAGRRSGKRS